MSHGQLCADGPTEEVTRVYDEESKLETTSWAKEMVGSDPTKCPIYITKMEMTDEAGKLFDVAIGQHVLPEFQLSIIYLVRIGRK